MTYSASRIPFVIWQTVASAKIPALVLAIDGAHTQILIALVAFDIPMFKSVMVFPGNAPLELIRRLAVQHYLILAVQSTTMTAVIL